MNPSVRDRLGSVVRALNAQEQVMLAMGHIQIILAQMDAAPAFEEEEAADLKNMAEAVVSSAAGGATTTQAVNDLTAQISRTAASSPGERTAALQEGIDAVLSALAKDGEPASRSAVTAAVLKQGAVRADKDRRWFAAMGFDIDYSGG
jgi:RecB family exonuclease